MRKILTVISLAASAMALFMASSCNESSTIGSSIIQEQIEVVVDTSFTLTGVTRRIDQIQSKTVAQLIGRIKADGYGELSSEVVTQFMPALSLDTVGITVADIDSLALVMQFSPGEFVGDSVAPLGIEVYPLTTQLPYPSYSKFPELDKSYDPTKLLGSTIYNVTAFTATDSVRALSYREIRVKLPLSLGRKLYQAYVDDPSTFSSPTQFSTRVFPGVYIHNSYGSGRLTRIASSMIKMYYHRTFHNEETGKDSVVNKIGNYFAVTPEIITSNIINLSTSASINEMVDKGENILLAPAGLEVEMKFPLLDIIAAINSNTSSINVVNSLSLTIPAEKIENSYNISAPRYLLMVLTKDRTTFFDNNSLPDNKTSFYAEYDSSKRTYTFTGLRQYLADMMSKSDGITPDDYTFTLVPVSATFETNSGSYYYPASSTLSSILPYAATPIMARLKLDKAQVRLTYSKQTINK